ncbi:MAG: hypothetical protein ACJ8AO_03820 [Gemmatimonadaceae bacterium]
MAKLDGAGQSKMAALESATMFVQRLHGLVEAAALQVKGQQSIAVFGAQFRRAAMPLVGLLKGQFGMIADLVSNLILVATRGGGDQAKIRTMREGIGQLKVQLELAANQTKDKHAVVEERAQKDEPAQT